MPALCRGTLFHVRRRACVVRALTWVALCVMWLKKPLVCIPPPSFFPLFFGPKNGLPLHPNANVTTLEEIRVVRMVAVGTVIET